MQNLNKILIDVKKTIKQAGKAAMFYYKKEYRIKDKGEDSPVTEADMASEKVILEELGKYNYGILSEESTDDKTRLEKERVWLVDPLDGTKDFIDKTGEFTIMIGLVENGKIILGAVYQPSEDILYFAAYGQGAFKQIGQAEPEKIKVSQVDNLPNATMLSSRFHRSDLEIEIAEKNKIKKFIACGSAGLKICKIAEGAADFNINPSDKTWEWDVCAADIILSEAGGKLTDVKGNNFEYNKENPQNVNGYLVSNGLINDKIIQRT